MASHGIVSLLLVCPARGEGHGKRALLPAIGLPLPRGACRFRVKMTHGSICVNNSSSTLRMPQHSSAACIKGLPMMLTAN